MIFRGVKLKFIFKNFNTYVAFAYTVLPNDMLQAPDQVGFTSTYINKKIRFNAVPVEEEV